MDKKTTNDIDKNGTKVVSKVPTSVIVGLALTSAAAVACGATLIYKCTEPAPTKNQCTLTYNYNDKDPVDTSTTYKETYDVGATPTEPSWKPTLENYVFDGWHESADLAAKEFDFNVSLTKDGATAYAHWTPAPTPDVYYTISFDTDGGTSVDAKTVIAGEQITDSPSTTKTGWDFDGWYDGTNEVTFPYTVSATKTLKAHWTDGDNVHTITFHPENGEDTFTGTARNGSTLAAPAVPTYAGHKFDGWFTAQTGGTEFDFSTVFTSETEITDLYAHWTPDPVVETRTLTYNFNDKETTATSTTYEEKYESPFIPGTAPTWQPVKEGNKFLGWFESTATDAEAFDFTDEIPTAGATAYAHWEASPEPSTRHKVYFYLDTADQDPYLIFSYAEGDVILEPGRPDRSDQEFVGWYDKGQDEEGAQQIIFDDNLKMGTSDINYFAHWKDEATVTCVSIGTKNVTARMNDGNPGTILYNNQHFTYSIEDYSQIKLAVESAEYDPEVLEVPNKEDIKVYINGQERLEQEIGVTYTVGQDGWVYLTFTQPQFVGQVTVIVDYGKMTPTSLYSTGNTEAQLILHEDDPGITTPIFDGNTLDYDFQSDSSRVIDIVTYDANPTPITDKACISIYVDGSLYSSDEIVSTNDPTTFTSDIQFYAAEGKLLLPGVEFKKDIKSVVIFVNYNV